MKLSRQDKKISTLFKEKKNLGKRARNKDIDLIDSEDEIILSKESKIIGNNKKIKLDSSKINEFKKPLSPKALDICSKSTVDTIASKKYQNFDEENTPRENNVEMIIPPAKNIQQNKNKFELSDKTKNIIGKIFAKKQNEKEQKVSNKENDSSLLDYQSKGNNKNKRSFFTNSIQNMFCPSLSMTSSPNLLLLGVNNNNKNSKINNIQKFPSPPKLSQKTIEIMEKLRQSRESRLNRFDREEPKKKFRNESSLSSLHYKYDELIKKSRELRLPLKYKQLLDSFTTLEQVINLNKLRSNYKINTFDNIRKNIEEVSHHSFTLNIFQQILYVVPHFYIMKYVEKKGEQSFNRNDALSKDFDLLIEIPKDFKERMKTDYDKDFDFLEINFYQEKNNERSNKQFDPYNSSMNVKETKLRHEMFKNILNRLVNIYHDKFLQREKIKISFYPLEQKTWHHLFDPDKECEDIPLFEIPLPPNKTSVFQNTIMKNDIKNEIMKDTLSLLNIDSNTKNKNITNNSESKNKNEKEKAINKYVSTSLLEKIRAKQQANNILKEINDYNIYHNSNIDGANVYRELITQMKTTLLVNKKSLEMEKITEMLLESNRLIKDFCGDKEKVTEIIKKLCLKYPDFASVIKHSSIGLVVVLKDESFKIPDKVSIQ